MIVCSPDVLDQIIAHAKRDAPNECCGLLLGTEHHILAASPVENRAADSRRRYEIDPRDFLALVKQSRGSGRSIVGAYHSHPRSSAEPSDTDRSEAVDGFLYVIAGPVGVDGNVPIAAYRFDRGNFQPLRIVLGAKESPT